jgi:hypothetical protein
MTHATINLSTETLEGSASGVVHGPISIRVAEQSFPDAGWTDFVLVVLAWWCRALSRVLDGENDSIDVRFMEGPFVALVGPSRGRHVQLELTDGSVGRASRFKGEVLCSPLVDSVIAAANSVIDECRKRNWWSKDADELIDSAKRSGREVFNS